MVNDSDGDDADAQQPGTGGAASEPGEIDVTFDDDNGDNRGNSDDESPGLATMRNLLGAELDEARARRLLAQYDGQADRAVNVGCPGCCVWSFDRIIIFALQAYLDGQSAATPASDAAAAAGGNAPSSAAAAGRPARAATKAVAPTAPATSPKSKDRLCFLPLALFDRIFSRTTATAKRASGRSTSHQSTITAWLSPSKSAKSTAAEHAAPAVSAAARPLALESAAASQFFLPAPEQHAALPSSSNSSSKRKAGAEHGAAANTNFDVPYLLLAEAFDRIVQTKSRLAITHELSVVFQTVMARTMDEHGHSSAETLLAAIYLCTNNIAPAHFGGGC